MKKVLGFIGLLLPWFVGGLLFSNNISFYKAINKPLFSPPSIVFPIVWTILYILIALSTYLVYKNNNYRYIADYNKSLLINYFSNQIFTFLFFTIQSPFLALIDTIIVLISSLFLYYESKELNKFASVLLIPYILWNIFATILITFIFFMNL